MLNKNVKTLPSLLRRANGIFLGSDNGNVEICWQNLL